MFFLFLLWVKFFILTSYWCYKWKQLLFVLNYPGKYTFLLHCIFIIFKKITKLWNWKLKNSQNFENGLTKQNDLLMIVRVWPTKGIFQISFNFDYIYKSYKENCRIEIQKLSSHEWQEIFFSSFKYSFFQKTFILHCKCFLTH